MRFPSGDVGFVERQVQLVGQIVFRGPVLLDEVQPRQRVGGMCVFGIRDGTLGRRAEDVIPVTGIDAGE